MFPDSAQEHAAAAIVILSKSVIRNKANQKTALVKHSINKRGVKAVTGVKAALKSSQHLPHTMSQDVVCGCK